MNNRTVQDGDTGLSRTHYQIIESAYHLFAKQGYHTTAMRQIAQNAGVLPSNVYNYFDSKGVIYQSVLEQHHPWLAIHIDLTVPCTGGVHTWAFDFLQALAAKWVQDPDGLRLHLVEVLEFQGRHITMMYNRFQGMITALVPRPGVKSRNVDQVVEQLSESAVALFYLLLLNQCLQQVKRKTTSRKIMFDSRTMLNFWNNDALYKISHNRLSHAR